MTSRDVVLAVQPDGDLTPITRSTATMDPSSRAHAKEWGRWAFLRARCGPRHNAELFLAEEYELAGDRVVRGKRIGVGSRGV